MDILYKAQAHRIWLADLVFFVFALKFREVWPSEGWIWPNLPIRRFLSGEIDVLAASAQCFLPERALGWIRVVYAALARAFSAFNMQREVEEVVGKWREYMEAVPLL